MASYATNLSTKELEKQFMSQQFMLLESNPKMGLKDGIYQDITEPFRDSIVCKHLKTAVLDVFAKVDDKSLFSLDIAALCSNEPLNSALAPGQFRILESLDLGQVNKVLDLSEDFGGVSHFLADHVGQIESVKIDSGLAHIATNRCANKHNVCHISADIETLSYPSNHYDLIVIGQLESLSLKIESLTTLLNKLQDALSDHGVLVISAINRDRISKWLDARSINSDDAVEFSDLYRSKKRSEFADEFNRKELRDTLLRSNFSAVDIHANFSQAHNYKALFSEDYLTASVNGLNHFYNLRSLDNSNINEYLLYKRLVDEQHNLVDCASRFVAIAGRSAQSVRKVYDNDFTHFPNSKNKPPWQKTTSRARSAHSVEKTSSFDTDNRQSRSISDGLPYQPFSKGKLLIGDWLDALLDQDYRHFENLVQEYQDWLNSDQLRAKIQKQVFDISPSNVMVNKRGGERQYQLIGSERAFTEKAKTSVTPEFLLFSALFNFAHDNKSLLTNYATANDIHSIGMFILEHMPTVFQIDDLAPLAEWQEHVHGETVESTTSGSIALALSESLLLNNTAATDPSPAEYTLDTLQRIVSTQNSSLTGQSHRLKQLRIDNEHQNQRIDDLLAHRADLVKKSKKQQEDSNNLEQTLRAEIDHLHERLHAQHVRNDELHGYLLMRPSTRAKRVANRTLGRLTGKSVIDETVEAEPPLELNESPLPTGELIGQNTEDYQLWIKENSLGEDQIEAAKAEIEAMPIKPVFSILVPIYNTDPEYLLPMIESVQNQIYPHWQLCLVDDCSPKSYLKRILEHEALNDDRISIQLNEVNQGISVTTNDALAMAKGDYIALLDHDDEISIDALYENAKVINSTPDVGLIYSDEDKMDMQGQRLEAYFKPDYSPDLLHTNNYICHFTVIKKSIAEALGGFREGLDGSQDHDIIIRCAAAAKRIVHIPKILYHWRKIPGSTAVSYDSKSYAWEAGRKAVEDQLKKDETGVRVEFGSLKGTYRVYREIKGTPLVSIVIPFNDKPELLDSCISSILNRSSYENFEIVGVSNNSTDDLTFERMKHYTELDSRIRFIEKNVPFNFSAICNYGAKQAKGEYILLLNNDIEIISPDWIERLLEHAQRDEIGAVGGKLLYPDGRIQHAGVVTGMVGAAGHPHKFFPDNHIGYHGRLHMVYNVSAVTGAMLMVSKDKFDEVNGLDEDNLAVAYNDIDLCLKLLSKGYRNIFTPHSKATHHESISRGYEDTDEKLQRLLGEQAHFLATWKQFLEAGDPYYNPNLSLKNERFSLRFKD